MANKSNKGLKDPVADKAGKAADAELAQEMESFDPKALAQDEEGYLSADDIGAIHERRTAAPHPFDGYRLARNVSVGDGGDLSVSATHLVLLNPTSEPPPDASNENVTIYKAKKGSPPGGGGSPKKGIPKIVTLPTSHTRVVINRRGTENHQVIFDRDVMVSGRWFKCAIVKGHAERAQICFTFDKEKNRVFPDRRYLLADKKQSIPLLKMFEAIYSQRTKAEKSAKEFDAAQESTAADAV